MELKQAQAIAEKVVAQLAPHCRRIEVAGSIRRRRPFVNDIDIVCIVCDPWNLRTELGKMGQVQAAGEKLMRVRLPATHLDVYFATEETWATLLLIRTGSKESNIRLAARARSHDWRLAASGEGLFNEKNERIAGDTEQSIFEALGLPYQRPEDRN